MNQTNEDRDFQEWLARKKCCCRYNSGGICGYYSTGSHTSYCKYPSNPGQCSAALDALIFVDK